MPILSNPRRERFAQHVAEAGNGAAAYRLTYGAHGASAEVGASRLLRNDKVQRRVRELQGKAAKGAVMTLEEKRLFLAAVVRGEHTGAKMPDRLRAAELDSKLAGHLNGEDGEAVPSIVRPIVVSLPFGGPRMESQGCGAGSNGNQIAVPFVLTAERHAELMAKKQAAIEQRLAASSEASRWRPTSGS